MVLVRGFPRVRRVNEADGGEAEPGLIIRAKQFTKTELLVPDWESRRSRTLAIHGPMSLSSSTWTLTRSLPTSRAIQSSAFRLFSYDFPSWLLSTATLSSAAVSAIQARSPRAGHDVNNFPFTMLLTRPTPANWGPAAPILSS